MTQLPKFDLLVHLLWVNTDAQFLFAEGSTILEVVQSVQKKVKVPHAVGKCNLIIGSVCYESLGIGWSGEALSSVLDVQVDPVVYSLFLQFCSTKKKILCIFYFLSV